MRNYNDLYRNWVLGGGGDADIRYWILKMQVTHLISLTLSTEGISRLKAFRSLVFSPFLHRFEQLIKADEGLQQGFFPDRMAVES